MYLRGEAVQSLQMIFLQDWFYMTGEAALDSILLSTERIEGEGLGGVQLVAGGTR
ncbi:hypothetical protein GCM10020331_078300 [Ectobacillus funiculus]